MLLVALSHEEHFMGLTYRELDYLLMQDKRGSNNAGHSSLLWARVACCACLVVCLNSVLTNGSADKSLHQRS